VPSDWSRRLLALAGVAGLADSLYLTIAHYTETPLACSNTGVVNCDLVTRSSYGLVPGTQIPVSLGGVLWFAVSLALALAPPMRALAAAHVVWALGGLATVFYLVFAEARLGHLCEWCTLAHALVVLSLLIAVGRLAALTAVDAVD
jgi:uncharacterized membrane protein